MNHLLDILASGIHDAKNQLFLAESILAAAESQHGVDLSESRYAIEAAASRLSRTLTSYHLLRHDRTLAVTPCIVEDLCQEVVLNQKSHLEHAGIRLDYPLQPLDEWPLDRDLVTDMLNNAVQNAGRFARSLVKLTAFADSDGLHLCVEDDGPGFTSLPPEMGVGLTVASRLAELHVRKGRHGLLRLDNDSSLGGARFELVLP